MNKKIMEIFNDKNICGMSARYANNFHTVTDGWTRTDKGVLMIGVIEVFKMCQYKDQVLAAILEAKEEFTNRGKYSPYSEALETRFLTMFDEAITSQDIECDKFITKLHKVALRMVLTYVPVGVNFSGHNIINPHGAYNEKVLAGIVRKHIPLITDKDIIKAYKKVG